ncbi:hypothetical protein BY458DRAFT_493933 [Sporodiniella umbellata]|nr:hypothetical protein BY458DRAFT_493933 [Sporodiniella umbellata]
MCRRKNLCKQFDSCFVTNSKKHLFPNDRRSSTTPSSFAQSLGARETISCALYGLLSKVHCQCTYYTPSSMNERKIHNLWLLAYYRGISSIIAFLMLLVLDSMRGAWKKKCRYNDPYYSEPTHKEVRKTTAYLLMCYIYREKFYIPKNLTSMDRIASLFIDENWTKLPEFLASDILMAISKLLNFSNRDPKIILASFLTTEQIVVY